MFGTARLRKFWFMLAVVCGVTLCGDLSRQYAFAQAEGGEAGGQVEEVHQENNIVWFVRTSGAIGGLLLILSIYFVSQCGRLFVEFRPQVLTPPELVDEVEDLLQKRQFKEIYNVVKDDPSFYGRVLATGVAELPNGLNEAREVMERVGDSLTVEMEKKISMLAVLGTLGPMIGLLGTLKGMIASFSVIAGSETGMKASQVAGRYFGSFAADDGRCGSLGARHLLLRRVPQSRGALVGQHHAAG